MPRVKALMWTSEPQCEALKKNIKVYMAIKGMKVNDVANLFKVTTSAAYKKMKHPEKMDFDEICKLAHMLGIETQRLIAETEWEF